MSLPERARLGYEPVLRLLRERTGLVFPAHRKMSAERAISDRMRRVHVDDADSYRARLEARPSEFDDLVGSLTVGETYFFREPGQFDFLRCEILPELRRLRSADHVFRAWSAGCASGEEAYSLAIVFEEAGLGGQSRVLATDISHAALAKARAGRYRPWSLRGAGAAAVSPYLESRAAGALRLRPSLCERVIFEYLNLAVDAYPALLNGTVGLDVILCRNVLVYFEAETIRAVAERLFGALADGGWLLIAATDPPLPDDLPFERTITEAGVFYRRPLDDLSRAAISPAPEPESTAAAQSRFRFRSRPAPRVRLDARGSSLSRARRALSRGQYDEAVREAEACGDLPQAAAIRLRALAGADPERALYAAADAVTRHPRSVELHYLRAVLLLGAGRAGDAAQAARRLLALDRRLATGHFVLGTILERTGDFEGARGAYRRAARLCDEMPPEQPMTLGEGETAAGLAAAAAAQIAILDSSMEPTA